MSQRYSVGTEYLRRSFCGDEADTHADVRLRVGLEATDLNVVPALMTITAAQVELRVDRHLRLETLGGDNPLESGRPLIKAQ